MVLVFGLDIPLFEFMLVFMILLTAGIIFVLLELRRLNEYLLIERSDLRRLERDLGVLEREEQRLDAEESRLDVAPKKASKRGRPAKKASTKNASKRGRPAKKASTKKASKRGRPANKSSRARR